MTQQRFHVMFFIFFILLFFEYIKAWQWGRKSQSDNGITETYKNAKKQKYPFFHVQQFVIILARMTLWEQATHTDTASHTAFIHSTQKQAFFALSTSFAYVLAKTAFVVASAVWAVSQLYGWLVSLLFRTFRLCFV